MFLLPLKRAAIRLLTTDPVVALTSRSSGWATVFMLHRFCCEDSNFQGHSPDALRQFLGWLRRHRYEIVDVGSLQRRLLDGAPLARTVAFTLDDGYVDQAALAAGVFAEFDAPSTTFLATGFLDGEMWCWWDRVEHVLSSTRRQGFRVPVGDRSVAIDLSGGAQRQRSLLQFTEQCKWVPDAERESAIARLANLAEVDLPVIPPSHYRPMTWDQARRAEEQGMRFGAQTVMHPILSRVSNEQSRRELEQSWRRVVEELRHPVPVFCYPNGQPEDFGPREIGTLIELGFLGAVAGTGGHAEAGHGFDPFRVPRYPFAELLDINVMYAGGLERVKQQVRRLTRRRSRPHPLPELVTARKSVAG
jgi:peptidoglycan/xylan/chitin deacetylase (PgdA/CDA1 family)